MVGYATKCGKVWLGVFVLLAPMILVGCGGSKNQPHTQRNQATAGINAKSRTVYYTINERIPPHDNYLRDVFDSASAVTYLRKKVQSSISAKGYQPKDLDLVSSQMNYDPDALYLEVDVTIKFKGSDPVYVTSVSSSFKLRDGRKGKTVFKGGDSVQESAKMNYRSAIHKAIDKSLADLRNFPRYTSY